jgi:hypothetical protein
MNSHYNTRGSNFNKSPYMHLLKLFRPYTFIFYIPSFSIVKNSDCQQGDPRFLLYLPL